MDFHASKQPGLVYAWEGEVANLHSEIKRLRGALEEIFAIEDQQYGGDWDEIEQARQIARAALQAK